MLRRFLFAAGVVLVLHIGRKSCGFDFFLVFVGWDLCDPDDTHVPAVLDSDGVGSVNRRQK